MSRVRRAPACRRGDCLGSAGHETATPGRVRHEAMTVGCTHAQFMATALFDWIMGGYTLFSTLWPAGQLCQGVSSALAI